MCHKPTLAHRNAEGLGINQLRVRGRSQFADCCLELSRELNRRPLCVYRKLDSAILVVKSTENWV
jgi:hypothetical protein